MKKFLFYLNRFVSKHLYLFYIASFVFFVAMIFLPVLKHTRHPIYSSYFNDLRGFFAIKETIKFLTDNNLEHIIQQSIRPLIIRSTISLSLIVSSLVFSLIFYFKKKKLVFLFELHFLYWLIFFITYLPDYFFSVGFYMLLTLCVISTAYYIIATYFKRHPEYTPPLKQPKEKKLSDKERILQLEQQVNELNSIIKKDE